MCIMCVLNAKIYEFLLNLKATRGCSKMILSGRSGDRPLQMSWLHQIRDTICRVRRPRRTAILSFCYSPFFVFHFSQQTAKKFNFDINLTSTGVMYYNANRYKITKICKLRRIFVCITIRILKI